MSDLFWKEEVTALFDRADDALKRGHIEDAWQHFHGARRVEVYGLEALDATDPTADAVEARARLVREEALGALTGWRRRAVESLLGRTDLVDDVTGTDVRTASWILHKHYESVHRKRRSLQAQFRQLFAFGTVFGAVFLVLAVLPAFVGADQGFLADLVAFLEPPFPPAASAGGPAVGRPGFAAFVGLAGVVGASLFGMRSLKDQMLSTDVPQQIPTGVLTSARLLFGAVSALFFYFVVQTDLLTGVDATSAAALIVIGFAAGYSERMVAPAVETVASVTGRGGE